VTEPVTLDLHPGTVVLVDVWPVNYRALRWLSPTAPSVTFRALPSGFAHNGRWGKRWSQRLGWTDPDWSSPTLGDSAGTVELSSVDTPASPLPGAPVQYLDGVRDALWSPMSIAQGPERIVPTVTTEDAPVPEWAEKAVHRAKRMPQKDPYAWPLGQTDCVLALRISYLPPWVSRDLGTCLIVLLGDEAIAVAETYPGSASFATGICSGRRTITLTGPGEHMPLTVEPVTLDIAPRTVLVIEARPANRYGLRWLGNPVPSVSYRILQPGACQAFFQRLDELG